MKSISFGVLSSRWICSCASSYPVGLSLENVGSIMVQHKSRIPKMMFISTVLSSDPSRNSDGKMKIWRICVLKEAQRTTARLIEGEEYECDVTIGHMWYKKLYTETPLPTIKQDIPWL